MQSEFARDLADQNRPIEEAARERPGKAIRLRIHPQIFRLIEGKGGQYRAWRDVHWTLDLDTPAEAFSLRDALRLFFKTVVALGPDAVMTALKGATRKEDAA